MRYRRIQGGINQKVELKTKKGGKKNQRSATRLLRLEKEKDNNYLDEIILFHLIQ
jgi:hypothetical protein